VGRDQEANELAGLLREHRLVTITGPGGVGKTRLAREVVRELAGQFPDGVWFVGLGPITDPARVPAEIAAVLGVRPQGAQPVPQVLAEVLAPRRLLLVLDNCEHVLDEAGRLCADLLKASDELRILATSREQLWVSGEARYRLSPLTLPASDEPGEISRSEAVRLFTDRARRAYSGFTLGPPNAPLVARVVDRLDGMPLGIELAAARIEALGIAGLADRIDDAVRLLDSRDSATAARHRSLAAVADWSYRLLAPAEQRVFRRLAVFPGPFTLEAATAVAGPEAEPVVLRLVDGSLVAPPQAGPDHRMRYPMLRTLRSYGHGRLVDAGEEAEAAAALARFAVAVTEQASADLEASDQDRELAALQWLDAEYATVRQALTWALDHDADAALRIATALGPWWRQRGRLAEGLELLTAAAGRRPPAGPTSTDDRTHIRAQLWLGYLSGYGDLAGSVARYSAVCADGDRQECADALAARAFRRFNAGQTAEAAEDARRALTLAREARYPAGEAQALAVLAALSVTAGGREDQAEALSWAGQVQQALAAAIPAWVARWCRMILTHVLIEVQELDQARRTCAEGLAQSRAVGDLTTVINLLSLAMNLEWLAGRMEDARAHLREAADITARIGDQTALRYCIDQCALVCAATGQPAEALTLWAALTADLERAGQAPDTADDRELRHRSARALPPGQAREATDRGTRMTLTAAVEFVVMLTARRDEETARSAAELTERERELVTLVAQGHTNAQIAAQLFISIRTVASHLDRIRDKTGCRRRADLTRLALREGLV
jgi:non-specific serine/threonine protein kinase